MTFLGCDTDQLRTLSDTFGEKSARVEELLDQCRTLALAVRWEGPDADAFRDEVQQTVSKGTDVATTVERQGQDLVGQAEEQDGASAPDAVGGGAGSGAAAGTAPADAKDWGPLKGEASTKGPGMIDKVDSILDRARKKVMDTKFEPDDLGKAGARLAKALPVIGGIPDGIQVVKAMAAGDTSDAIGNAYEMMVGLIPHPAATVASNVNALAPGEKSPAHYFADEAAKSPGTRAGEDFGGKVSDLFGLDQGGTARNIVTSGSGMASHLSRALGMDPLGKVAEVGVPAGVAAAKHMR